MSQLSKSFVAPPELIIALQERSKPVVFGKDRVLFRQDDAPTSLYIVRKGTVRLTGEGAGDTPLSFRVGAGSLLGLPAVIGSKPYSLTAEATESAELSEVSSADFEYLMQTVPMFSFQVLKVLAEEVRFARHAFSEI